MGQGDQRTLVFLVEDNVLIRDSLVVTLTDLANADVVDVAATERDAAKWLQSNPNGWDLVVIDLFLLQGSGLGVLRACRGRLPVQRAVVLTNYATEEIRVRCMAAGADAVFDKSTEIDDFLEFCNR